MDSRALALPARRRWVARGAGERGEEHGQMQPGPDKISRQLPSEPLTAAIAPTCDPPALTDPGRELMWFHVNKCRARRRRP